MPYNRFLGDKVWKNLPSRETPIIAGFLTHLENALSTVTEATERLSSELSLLAASFQSKLDEINFHKVDQSDLAYYGSFDGLSPSHGAIVTVRDILELEEWDTPPTVLQSISNPTEHNSILLWNEDSRYPEPKWRTKEELRAILGTTSVNNSAIVPFPTAEGQLLVSNGAGRWTIAPDTFYKDIRQSQGYSIEGPWLRAGIKTDVSTTNKPAYNYINPIISVYRGKSDFNFSRAGNEVTVIPGLYSYSDNPVPAQEGPWLTKTDYEIPILYATIDPALRPVTTKESDWFKIGEYLSDSWYRQWTGSEWELESVGVSNPSGACVKLKYVIHPDGTMSYKIRTNFSPGLIQPSLGPVIGHTDFYASSRWSFTYDRTT